MSDVLTLELTKAQRELLLRGLRYVRSSVLLETHDPTEEFDREREEALEPINLLVEQLSGTESANTAARL